MSALPNLYPTISAPLPGARLRALSLGVGIESTTLALLFAAGLVGPMIDVAIFGDTDDEEDHVYEQLQWLKSDNMALPFSIVTVSNGSLAEDFDAVTAGTKRRMSNPPLFIRNDDGSRGIITRGCTQEYKIRPVERELKRLLGLRPHDRLPREPVVELSIGISMSEVGRLAPSTKPHIQNRHPLIEIGWTTERCERWVWDTYGVRLKSSGCKRCPYRDDREWSLMKRERPDAFAIAVAADHAGRRGFPQIRGEAFLHDSLQPLDQVDFETKSGQGQLDLSWLGECTGRCRV